MRHVVCYVSLIFLDRIIDVSSDMRLLILLPVLRGACQKT